MSDHSSYVFSRCDYFRVGAVGNVQIVRVGGVYGHVLNENEIEKSFHIVPHKTDDVQNI